MTFKIYKTIAGKVRVKYTCPHCNDALESELAEAGSKDTCPSCQKPFVVPGEAKRKEFEAQLRQQIEAKKEAEQQRLAEAERQRIASAAALAQREAARAVEQMTAKANESLAVTYEPPRTSPQAPPAFIAPRYRALEFYMGVLQVCGWLCIAVLLVAICVSAYAAISVANRADSVEAVGALLGGIGFSILGTVPAALMFFVGAQMVQLALDARKDLAHSVAIQAAMVQQLRQTNQWNG